MNAALHADEDLRDLYRELILDHARNPRHFGRLAHPTHAASGVNPLCGDKLSLFFSIAPNGTIEDAMFEGSGCAISIASASLMAETIIGKSALEARQYFASLISMLTGVVPDNDTAAGQVDLGKLVALAGVREFPARVKCATLAWHALDSAIRNDSKPATTE